MCVSICLASLSHSLYSYDAFSVGNIDVQAESISMLARDDLDFQWLLPGEWVSELSIYLSICIFIFLYVYLSTSIYLSILTIDIIVELWSIFFSIDRSRSYDPFQQVTIAITSTVALNNPSKWSYGSYNHVILLLLLLLSLLLQQPLLLLLLLTTTIIIIITFFNPYYYSTSPTTSPTTFTTTTFTTTTFTTTSPPWTTVWRKRINRF